MPNKKLPTICLCIVICLIAGLVYSEMHEEYNDISEVVIISSYTPSNFCGESQIDGILDTLRQHYKGNIFLLHYLCLRRCTTDPYSRSVIAKRIVNEFKNKDLSQFKFIITDDLAFRHMLQVLPPNVEVYFSGINGSFQSYKKSFPQRQKWCGVLEYADYSKLFTFFDQIGYPVTSVAIVYDKWSSTTQFIVTQIKKQLQDVPIEIDYIPVKTMSELESIASDLNHYDVVLSIVLTLKDFDTFLPVDVITRRMRQLITTILVGINPVQIMMGYDLVVSVDFYEMGQTVAQMVVNNQCAVTIPKTYIYVRKHHSVIDNSAFYNSYDINKVEVEDYVREIDPILQ